MKASGKETELGDFYLRELSMRDFGFSEQWYLVSGYEYSKWCWGNPMEWVNGKMKQFPNVEVLAMAEVVGPNPQAGKKSVPSSEATP